MLQNVASSIKGCTLYKNLFPSFWKVNYFWCRTQRVNDFFPTNCTNSCVFWIPATNSSIEEQFYYKPPSKSQPPPPNYTLMLKRLRIEYLSWIWRGHKRFITDPRDNDGAGLMQTSAVSWNYRDAGPASEFIRPYFEKAPRDACLRRDARARRYATFKPPPIIPSFSSHSPSRSFLYTVLYPSGRLSAFHLARIRGASAALSGHFLD